jgi:competence protein ComEA
VSLFNNFLNGYFGFNKQQRNGLFVLMLISFGLLVVRLVYPSFINPDPIIVANLPLIKREGDSIKKNNSFKKTALFSFDPNKISFEELVQLGLKEKTARTFLNLRKKGFVFREKNDLKKVYGINNFLFQKLEPYIVISEKEVTANINHQTSSQIPEPIIKSKRQIKVELNSADSLSLIAINGIGPTFAKRILKYRSILGGYNSIEQLKEVYGFSEELYEKVKPQFSINQSLIKKINVNKDDFKTINKHPYIGYELTKSIFNFRKATTINQSNLKDLLHDDALYMKLLPYLVFD